MPNIEGFDFDLLALRKRYDEERDERSAMRPEGLAQSRQTTDIHHEVARHRHAGAHRDSEGR